MTAWVHIAAQLLKRNKLVAAVVTYMRPSSEFVVSDDGD